MQEWLAGFETACLEADNIQALPTSNITISSNLGEVVDLVDRVRICAQEDESAEELISDELIDGLTVSPNLI